MILNRLPCILLSVGFCFSVHGGEIRLLNWWDYLSTEMVNIESKMGYTYKLTVYKSNDDAISRLLTQFEGIDVAIVSYPAMRAIESAGKILQVDLSKIYSQRTYGKHFKTSTKCLPYLWAATVFMSSDPKQVPRSFVELMGLRQKGFQIAIIDDSTEVALRLVADQPEMKGRPGEVDFYRKNAKGFDAFSSLSAKPVDFVSSLVDRLQSAKIAAYGWHGEALSVNSKDLVLAPPYRHPVIGQDYVCVINNSRTRKNPKFFRNAIERFTSREALALAQKDLQYFSPFEGHYEGLQIKYLDLKKEIEKMPTQTAFHIQDPSTEDRNFLSFWWRKTRYAK